MSLEFPLYNFTKDTFLRIQPFQHVNWNIKMSDLRPSVLCDVRKLHVSHFVLHMFVVFLFLLGLFFGLLCNTCCFFANGCSQNSVQRIACSLVCIFLTGIKQLHDKTLWWETILLTLLAPEHRLYVTVCCIHFITMSVSLDLLISFSRKMCFETACFFQIT